MKYLRKFFNSLGKIFIIFMAFGFFCAMVIVAIFLYVSMSLPRISSLADYNPAIPSEIFSSDGHLLLELSKEKRYIADIDEIPQVIVDALVSAEDDKFFEHSGVDYIGVFRAMLANIQAGRVVQGGSTITQQVAKSLLLTSQRSYTRKIKDFLLAQKIEKKFSKKEILFLYLNQMYFGGGYYGIKSASRGYFDKDLDELTSAEGALLAGLLAAPGRYSPYVNPIYAKRRQNYVLGRMYATNKITREEYEKALAEDIRMKIRKPSPIKAGYFTDWVRQRVIDYVGQERFLTEGFKVVTSIDWELQQVAREEVVKGAREIDRRQGYKGPLKKLDYTENPNALTEYEISFRENYYNNISDYFVFTKDGEINNEYVFKREEYDKIQEYYLQESESKYRKYFEAGIAPDDSLPKLLKVGDTYEAVVTKISDSQRIIYLSIGGARAIIPYEGFSWAHERVLLEERKYIPNVTKPTRILEPGHVVLVKVTSGQKALWWQLYSDYRKRINNRDLIQEFKKHKFIICELEQEVEVQASLIALSHQTQRIISLVGGTDFSKSQYNRAIQAERQPGSAFKPFIYAAGLENGYTPVSILVDSPAALGGVDDSLSWKPRNYDLKFMGPMPFRRALEKSRNVPTIKLAESIGVDKIINFSNRFNLNAKLPADLSLSLGTFSITLYDLVKGYAVFPNGGKKFTAKSILSVTDRYGNQYDVDAIEGTQNKQVEEDVIDDDPENFIDWEILENNKDELVVENPYTQYLSGDQVYDSRLSYVMINLLKGVVQNGTGMLAKNVSPFIGAKTGTTNNFIDAWFVGFSPNIVTGVWTGFDDNKTMGWAETGAKSALPIWSAYMKKALSKFGEYDFTTPEGIINVMIDKDTGGLATSGTKNAYMESFVEGTEPSEEEEIRPSESDIKSQDTTLDDDDYFIHQ